MIIGTTPTFTLKMSEESEIDFSNAVEIYFTARQGSITITKSGEDITVIDPLTVTTTLTQRETLQFKPNLELEIQLNWTYPNGVRAASKIKKIQLYKNLIKEVL